MRRPDLRRAVGVAAAAVLLALTAAVGSAAPPAAAQVQDRRPPGVPPPVDLLQLPPQALVDTLPFDHSFPGTFEQVGEPLLDDVACVASGSPGETVERVSWGQARMRFDELHRLATGTGQRVAVIDTGVAPHPRFENRLIGGGDYIVGGPNGRDGLADCDGHGTLVAGIIGASRDPDTGFMGIAPDAEILAIRQSSTFFEVPGVDPSLPDRPQKSIAPGDTRSLALAIMRAIDKGATVINISEAACFASAFDQVNAPDLQAAVHFATSRDIVVVAAAGNLGGVGCSAPNLPHQLPVMVSSPGWFDDDVLTVGAVQENGVPAEFSLAGPWVDVSGPGTDITSLDPASPEGNLTNQTQNKEGELNLIQGTSFSTPYVAGLAALIKERFPGITAREVMHRIKETAQQAAGPEGRDDFLGHGMIDPVAALTAVVPPLGNAAEDEAPAQGALENLTPQPVRDPQPARIAVIGTGSGLLALAVTGFVVFTVARHRNRARTA